MIGLCLTGITASCVFVPLLSDIIDAIEEKEGVRKNPFINDRASALFNTASALGTVIGPVIGGVLDDALGWASSCDVFALVTLGSGTLYVFLGLIPTCVRLRKKRNNVEN